MAEPEYAHLPHSPPQPEWKTYAGGDVSRQWQEIRRLCSQTSLRWRLTGPCTQRINIPYLIT